MSDNLAANLVGTRGNRCTAAILGWCEDNIKADITERQWQQLRSVVLDQINGFKDLSIDIVKSDAAIMNQVWVEKLDEIHQELKEMRAS